MAESAESLPAIPLGSRDPDPHPSEEPERRRGTHAPLLVGAAAALLLLAGGLYWLLELRGRIRTDNASVEGHFVFMSPRVAGYVVDVAVQENQRVERGALLVRLDPAVLDAGVARARADLDAARNRMEQARAAVAAAEADHRAAEVELRQAERELERERELHARHVASDRLLDDARARRDAAVARSRALDQKIQAERALLGNEAPVAQARAALREAELALSYALIVAPFAGVVGRTRVEVGQYVAPSQPLLGLTEDSARWVIANFKETQIARMRVGDPAEVQVDAYPGILWRGHVESIGPATGAKYAFLPADNATGNFTKVVQRVPVRIAIDGRSGSEESSAAPSPATLSVGLSVEVSVRVD